MPTMEFKVFEAHRGTMIELRGLRYAFSTREEAGTFLATEMINSAIVICREHNSGDAEITVTINPRKE